MESLRAQLAETQGALTERDKKFRQLKAESLQTSKLWTDEKLRLEARIAQLESENLRLKGALPAATDNPGKLVAPTDQKTKSPEIALTHKGTGNGLTLMDQDADEGNIIKHSRMKQAEAQFESLADEVTANTKLIEALGAKHAQSSPTPILTLSDEQIATRWIQLREKIRALSLEYLSQPFSASLVSDKYKGEFMALSPHWKTYASQENITCYLFRALIWRYLLRYFKTPCRAYGRDISSKVRDVAELISKKASDAEYQDWRIRTATIVHKLYPIDKVFIDELTAQILEAITPLVVHLNAAALKALKDSLRGIVTTTAELSAAFDQCCVIILMSNHPGSVLTHGFQYAENIMEMRAKLSSQGVVVDLMITPSLLKKEADYSVLVKAEVVC
ncbi:hypothetical protein EV127DRAFT_403466 [Xylaria flabelliformis]|nr:hypothetical protein EV127DRAFT_403466 [Xylaria flabelliformis]